MRTDSPPYVDEASAGDPIGLARMLVSIPSVNPTLTPGGEGEALVSQTTAELLEAWGFDVTTPEVAPGRRNVVARLNGAPGPTLLLNGHLDTVGVEGMTIPPFGAQLLGSRLLGRGAADMKGGVASLLAAACRLSRSGPRPTLVVALTVDEEHASLGMEAFVREGPQVDLAIVCEPTSLSVAPSHKGFVWVRGFFEGRAAHGSLPEEGIDAIRHAALFVAALDQLSDALRSRPSHPLLGYASLHVGTIRGGTAPSVYPDSCEMQVECRVLPDTTPTDMLAELEAILLSLKILEPRLRGSLEITLERPATEVSIDTPLVKGLLAVCQREGVRPALSGVPAWVDAAFLNRAGIPAVCFGPGSMAQAHTKDEWIETSEIVRCAGVLEAFARSLVGGP